MIAFGALAASSFLASPPAVGTATSALRHMSVHDANIGSRCPVLICGMEGRSHTTQGRVAQLDNAVNDLSISLGRSELQHSRPVTSDDAPGMHQECSAERMIYDHRWRAREDARLRYQLERYVRSLELQLLSLSRTYEAVDCVCDVPLVPERAMNNAYVSALEEAVAAAQRSASDMAPGVYWCDDDFVRTAP